MEERRNSSWGTVPRWRSGLLATVAVSSALLGLVGCADAGNVEDTRFADDALAADAAAASGEAAPMTAMGAFLAGRVAQEDRKFGDALGFYRDALARSPNSVELANHVLVLSVTEGRFDIAGPVAAKLAKADPDGAGLAQLVVTVEQAKAGHYTEALDAARHLPKEGFYRLVGGFARAWALAADPDHATAAAAELDDLQASSPAPLKALQTALVQDLTGDAANAAANYRAAFGSGGGTAPLRMVELAGNFLERHGQPEEAGALYLRFAAETDGASGVDLAVSSGGPPARIIATPRQGLAEAMFDMASLAGQAESPDVAMLNVRLALELEPNFPLAQLVLGDVLETEHRLPEALAVYRAIDPASPFAWSARLREASLRDQTGDTAGAEAELAAMADERRQRPEPLIELADLQRSHDEFAKAVGTYNEALARIGGDPPARDWSILFSRGIAEERSSAWKQAEIDLRKALELRPNEPSVLNYLGYSLVDRNERLPEALKLIKEAVDLRPTDGFIVDSLGWAYYRLGDYKNAQTTLERAVELQPADAEITSHLGDAYWQGGRRAEARLQWRRALDLNPAAELAKAITAKLDHPPRLQRPGSAPATHGS
ncbi:MAG: tetratricopeptide repeat protein [Aliidongia sp.]